MIKYLLERRFNLIDSMAISAMCIYLSQGIFKMALVAACMGILANMLGLAFHGKRSMDRQWQELAKAGNYVAALKKHRELYGSTLREAQNAVHPYMGKPPV